MKPKLWEILVAGILLIALSILIFTAAFARGQSAKLTSDASQAKLPLPNGAMGIFMPPQPSICIVFHTNTEALLVRVTISSNVTPCWRWTHEGQLYTNWGTPLSSNVISVVTNAVP